jgi:hypothetical protein
VYPFVGLSLVLLLNAGGKVVALGDVGGDELVQPVLSGAGGRCVLVRHGSMINIECDKDKS